MTGESAALQISVVYALAERQASVGLRVAAGTTIGAAIARSRILERFPEIDLERNRVGIFGRVSALDRVVEDGDRVEIYRPLRVDPREQRRRRAEAQRAR